MADLKPLLKKAAREYEARKAAAESRVARWEYWSGPAYDPKPYYLERNLRSGLVKRGKRLTKPAARGCAYGFDVKGRVVVDRQPPSDEPAFDEFFTHHSSGIESAAYARDGKHALRYVTRQAHRGGRPVSTDVLDAGGRVAYSETYKHRDGRLACIDVTSRDGKSEKRVKYDLVYEPDGRLRTIRRSYDHLPRPFPIYWNPQSGETLDSLVKGMHKTLVRLIPAAVARAKVREAAYCVCLIYDVADDELPPTLGIGSDRQRRQWVATKGKAAKALIWNPAELARNERGTLELDSPTLARESEKLLQMALMHEDLDVPTNLLNGVAAELNKRSWNNVLPVTDDFIVYAVDVDGDDLKKKLKAAVPATKRKLLKARRLM